MKNMSRLFVVGLVIIISLFLIGCENNEIELDETHTASDYEFDYPSDWEVVTIPGIEAEAIDEVLYEIDPPHTNFGVVVEEGVTESPEEYLDEEQYTMIDDFSVRDSYFTSLDDEEAYKLIFEGTGEEGEKLIFYQLAAIPTNKAYVLTFTANEENYSAYQDTIEKVIESFSFN